MIDKSPNRLNENYHISNYQYVATSNSPITTKNVAAGCITHVTKLDNDHQLAVCIAYATGNVSVRIKATGDEIDSDKIDYDRTVKVTKDYIYSDELEKFISVPTTTHEFVIDKNQQLNYINQPNSIWLPEIPLQKLILGQQFIDYDTTVNNTIWRLIKTYDLTTTSELMALLNQCFVEVDYVIDIFKITTPTTSINGKWAMFDIDYLGHAHETYVSNNADINDLDTDDHTKTLGRYGSKYTKAEIMQKYYMDMYDTMTKTNMYNIANLISIHNNIKFHRDHIKTGYQMLFNKRIDTDEIGVFDIINNFNINNQVEIKSMRQLYHMFASALLQNNNTSILDILLENIDTQIKYEINDTNQPLEIQTLTANPAIVTYLKEHQISITTQLKYSNEV